MIRQYRIWIDVRLSWLRQQIEYCILCGSQGLDLQYNRNDLLLLQSLLNYVSLRRLRSFIPCFEKYCQSTVAFSEKFRKNFV